MTDNRSGQRPAPSASLSSSGDRRLVREVYLLLVVALIHLAMLAWLAAPLRGQEPGEAAAGSAAEDTAAATATGDTPAAESGDATTPAGHSYHGEAFNDGPRQQAYLMPGMSPLSFPVTTANEQAQKFVEQGVAQLHGFWYFEAERSFRQAAALDADCAMAYWGMAMANTNNEKRAKDFIAKAMERKDKASPRERLYIEALERYLTADPKDKRKERAERYTKDLEKLLYEHPDDLEAKAFLALQLWQNRTAGVPITSYLAVDALLDQVFAANPMHPAHHYRIHLWDGEKPENALASAARCGQSSPGIAHMWHMPGHIYSRLKRYDDACWQQEASARVDHAHMMRDRVMPDQIHNFAHNNEWFIRNLIHVGRISDAIDLARNMISLPRHPNYNMLDKRGSYNYGRLRLFQVLSTFERWEELIAACESQLLPATEKEAEQLKRLEHLAMAYCYSGRLDQGQAVVTELHKKLDRIKAERDQAIADAREKARQGVEPTESAAESPAEEEATDGDPQDNIGPPQPLPAPQPNDAPADQTKPDANQEKPEPEKSAQVQADQKKAEQDPAEQDPADQDKPEQDPADAEPSKAEDAAAKNLERKIEEAGKRAERPFGSRIRAAERAVNEAEGHLAMAQGEYAKAHELLKKASGVDPVLLARAQFFAGEQDKALEALQKHVKNHENEVQPLAGLAHLQFEAGRRDEAHQTMQKLRDISSWIDLDSPVFQRLQPLVADLQWPADWRLAVSVRDDVGDRPSLDDLGPFRWGPSDARPWSLVDAEGQMHSLKDYDRKPVVVIFYLGYGCLHCAEQLHAFAPLTDKFREAGISLIAISSDDQEGLKISLKNYKDGTFPFPLVSNPGLDIFKAYRAYDDFEQQPLHGTFLIDGDGRVRWQDISYEPFMDPNFVLDEAQRLLHLERPAAEFQVQSAEARAPSSEPNAGGE